MATNTPQASPSGINKTASVTINEILPPKDTKPAQKDRLNLGESLLTDEALTSPNAIYRLLVQGDGNVVLYKKDVGCLWASDTYRVSDSWRVVRATLNNDGNFVMYSKIGYLEWESKTSGKDVKALILQDDGNLVLSTGTSNAWATNTVQKTTITPAPTTPAPTTPGSNTPATPKLANPPVADPSTNNNPASNSTLLPGQTLAKGQELYSPNKKFKLVMQGDGNCCLYSESGPYWGTKTNVVGNSLILQNDGNLCVLSKWGGPAAWSTRVRPPWGNHSLSLRDTGDLVIGDANGHILWSNNASLISPYDIWIKNATHTTSPLVPGEYLIANQPLISPNGCFLFSFTSNGALTLKDKLDRVLWTSETSYPGAHRLLLQFDGNLVLMTIDRKPLWTSNTGDTGEDTRFNIYDDGNVGVLTFKWGAFIAWQTKTFFPVSASNGPVDRLKKGESLAVGQTLISRNGKYKFQFQDNYNSTIRNEQNSATLYRTATAPGLVGAQTLTLSSDGIFHIKDSGNVIKWSSLLSTSGWADRQADWVPITDKHMLAMRADPLNYRKLMQDNSRALEPIYHSVELIMQDDGNLVMRKNNTSFWNIGTFPTGDFVGSQINDTLKVNGILKLDGSMTSYNGLYTLSLRPDSNLCINHKTFGTMWKSNTDTRRYMSPSPDRLIMQPDGNLVLYHATANSVMWATNTNVNSFFSSTLRLVIHGDGTAKILFGNGIKAWETDRQAVADLEANFLTDIELAREGLAQGRQYY